MDGDAVNESEAEHLLLKMTPSQKAEFGILCARAAGWGASQDSLGGQNVADYAAHVWALCGTKWYILAKKEIERSAKVKTKKAAREKIKLAQHYENAVLGCASHAMHKAAELRPDIDFTSLAMQAMQQNG